MHRGRTDEVTENGVARVRSARKFACKEISMRWIRIWRPFGPKKKSENAGKQQQQQQQQQQKLSLHTHVEMLI